MQELAKFSSNPGKVHFEGLVQLFRYIRDNTTFRLKYYSDMNDSPVYYMLRQASIENKNKLMAFSDSSWQDFPYTERNTGSYIIFIKLVQLTMAHMFQEQFLNQVQKVSTMQHALQEWIYHISEN